MSNDASASTDENNRENQTSVSCNATVTDSLDSIFSLLGNSRCRHLLYHLFTMDGNTTEYDTAVDAVYRYERAGTKPNDRPSREEIRLAVQHDLLPRLGEAEVLEYDNRQETIRFREPPELKEWVERARKKELE